MKLLVTVLVALTTSYLFAQEDTLALTSDSLMNVTVTGFHSSKYWKDEPAAIAILNEQKLQQFQPNSLLPSFNTVAGVRMEERSPGSYRLSIRGSLLRSPFGVRNIKVYWNSIPLSDGGGNAYLQLVETQNITGAEILKGPTSSLYGANTGGAVLLKSGLTLSDSSIYTAKIVSLNDGDGMASMYASAKRIGKGFSFNIQQAYNQNNGYREQSSLKKGTYQLEGNSKWKNNQLGFLVFYTDLHYQTPGAIMFEQMLANPKLSRQATASLPSAIQQKTAIYNKTFFAGTNHSYSINKSWSLENTLATSFTNFKNPFIINYETRKESNLALRTQAVYHKQIKQIKLQWVTGAEWLSNQSSINNYGNRNGEMDTVQYMDKVRANQWFGFTQVQLSFNRFSMNVGLSFSQQLYAFRRLPASSFLHAKSNVIAAPRLALSYKLSNGVSLYMLAAKGFSPPSLAEVHPSDGNFYSSLQPEHGWNIEAGAKGNLFSNRLMFDISFYHFKLRDAIVKRNNIAGEYFINAGSTLQKGMEVFVQYKMVERPRQFLSSLTISNSFSYQPYKFNDYTVGTISYNGKALTGVPKNINVTTIEARMKRSLFANIIINHTSSIPLTDANDTWANNYTLVQLKVGMRILSMQSPFLTKKQFTGDLFFGIDNLLNQLYSLGNDINALGKRYYNPAPARNYFMGVKIEL